MKGVKGKTGDLNKNQKGSKRGASSFQRVWAEIHGGLLGGKPRWRSRIGTVP